MTALPPPAEEEVTPWQEARQMVLCGIGLTTITLRVLYLHIILPAVGAMLLVLGALGIGYGFRGWYLYYNDRDQ